MTRPDLDKTESVHFGWQAIDSTPQELSGGIFQTGPCPLSSIKIGEKNIDYDLEFIFSEVNADIHDFIEKEDGTFPSTADYITIDGVGSKILTKAVGAEAEQDVILEYKYPEGSIHERAAFYGDSGSADKGDLTFTFDAPKSLPIGQSVTANFSIKKKDGSDSASRNVR